jgi:hypothetical protein
MVMIDRGPRESIKWPSREEWARQHRTYYGDSDDLRVSDRLADYATPEEIAEALAEAKALWAEMGRQMKKAGAALTDAEYRKRFREALQTSRQEVDKFVDSPESNRIYLRDQRSRLNRHIIKPLREGWLPRSSSPGNWVESFRADELPKTCELCRRYWIAWHAAYEAKKAEYAARPIDDAAWEEELRRRESVTAWLNGDRFGRRAP